MPYPQDPLRSNVLKAQIRVYFAAYDKKISAIFIAIRVMKLNFILAITSDEPFIRLLRTRDRDFRSTDAKIAERESTEPKIVKMNTLSLVWNSLEVACSHLLTITRTF